MLWDTVETLYNTVNFSEIFIKTLHSSPERARYGVSFVSSKGNILCRLIKIELYKIFAIINRAIKGLHCTLSVSPMCTIKLWLWIDLYKNIIPRKIFYIMGIYLVLQSWNYFYLCYSLLPTDKVRNASLQFCVNTGMIGWKKQEIKDDQCFKL